MKFAFSLVELSIVLVILGLLTGGILAGQSLIRAAEIRSISSEFSRYIAATQTFRDKYMALPGDMANATSFWGKDNTNCSSHTGTAAAGGTCNGNGDGKVGLHAGAAASVTREELQYFKQLALAGLIEGTYTGIAGSSTNNTLIGSYDVDDGTNTPLSRLSQASWAVLVSLEPSWNAFFAYPNDTQNYLVFGASPGTRVPFNGIITPEEAWGIDTKMDDGKPGYGSLLGVNWNNACSAADDGGHAANDFVASYRLTNTAKACALMFVRPF